MNEEKPESKELRKERAQFSKKGYKESGIRKSTDGTAFANAMGGKRKPAK
jgi:hypothetical protein